MFFHNTTEQPETAVHGYSVKGCSEKNSQILGKTLVPDSLF